MSAYEFYFLTSGPKITAQVTPTMEALGDQPWRVVLTFTPGSIPQVSHIIETSTALLAATEAVRDWLKDNGPDTNFLCYGRKKT